MGRIDQLTEQRIKDAASIEDVVGDFVELRRSGKDLTGLCPFHDDRHLGSFFVSPSKNVCSCFSCGWRGGPVDFLMKHEGMKYGDALRWLAAKYGVWIKDEQPMQIKVQKAKPREPRPELPLITFPLDMVKAKMLKNQQDITCNVVEWMRSLPWSDDMRKMLEYNLQLYAVGVSDKGKTKGWAIWWYIDEKRQVRTGKLMAYKPDGHRDKLLNPYTRNGVTKYYNFDFITSMTERKRCEPKGQRWLWDENTARSEGCLFGLHLLNIYPDAEVCIVESEKTAIIAQTITLPGKKIFMATASKGNLTRRMLQPLIDAHRWIILYPDVDGLKEWQKVAEQMEYDRITVTAKVQQLYCPDLDDPKSDIADILIRMMLSKPADVPTITVKTLANNGIESEALTALINTFELELKDLNEEPGQ